MPLVTYDVSEHPLLNAQAKALAKKDDEAFAERTAYAAELLGISDTTYSGVGLTKIRRALALEINWLLDLPMEAFYKKSSASSASKQSVTYRDGIGLIFPLSAQMVAEVNGSGEWADCTSVRRAVR